MRNQGRRSIGTTYALTHQGEVPNTILLRLLRLGKVTRLIKSTQLSEGAHCNIMAEVATSKC